MADPEPPITPPASVEPPITSPASVEPPFDPAATSAPGPAGPAPAPGSPDAPYGAFGDSTGTTTIRPPDADGVVRVDRETYGRAGPTAPGPIEDRSLEDLLNTPLTETDAGAPGSRPAADDGPQGGDRRRGGGFLRP